MKIIKNIKQKIYILVYLCISLYFANKPVIIKHHAIKRAKERNISFPDQVYDVIKTGKMKKFAKNRIKFMKKSENSSIICIGEDLGHVIIIKTIERGN